MAHTALGDKVAGRRVGALASLSGMPSTRLAGNAGCEGAP